MRRLVVCADGTWNSEQKKDDGSGLTNVVRLRDAVAPRAPDGTEQVVFYHTGVGTGGWWDRATGGAFGTGISRNIKACYAFLVREFKPGDELFLFGFSRGAYTVRSLAGLVRNCGVLRQSEARRIDEAYELYRDRGDDTHPNSAKAQAFRAAHSVETRVKCIGVWDTVGALGVPTRGPVGWISRRRHGFHDVRLSSSVENAFHALAIDERRGPFEPALWEVRDGDPARKAGRWRVEQRWFAGVHSNVGGGYPDCGLSNLALRWMMTRAESCGLAFRPGGAAALDAECDCGGALYDSFSALYKPLGPHVRALGARRVDRDSGEALHTYEEVDGSVVERHAKHGPYAPPNFLAYWKQNPDKWAPDHLPPA